MDQFGWLRGSLLWYLTAKNAMNFFITLVINKVRKAVWLSIVINLKYMVRIFLRIGILSLSPVIRISFDKRIFFLHEAALGMEAVSFCETLNFWQSLTLQPLSQKI